MEENLNLGKYEGRYYRQGPQLRYKPEEDVVYNDTYQTPLKELLERGRPKSVVQMRSLLDDNGYIGRHKIRRNYLTGVYPLNTFKVQVSLIWGETSYLWPHQGEWDMDFHRIERSSKLVLPSGITEAVGVLYKYLASDPYTLRTRAGMSLKSAEEVIATLENMRLIKDGNLKIVDDLELKEVIDNLLTM